MPAYYYNTIYNYLLLLLSSRAASLRSAPRSALPLLLFLTINVSYCFLLFLTICYYLLLCGTIYYYYCFSRRAPLRSTLPLPPNIITTIIIIISITSLSLSLSLYIYIYTYACTSLSLYIYVYIYMYIHICMYVCIHIYIYIHMYVALPGYALPRAVRGARRTPCK